MKLITFILLTSFIGVYAVPNLPPPQGLKRQLTIGGSSIFRDPRYDEKGRLYADLIDGQNEQTIVDTLTDLDIKPPKGLQKRCVADPYAVADNAAITEDEFWEWLAKPSDISTKNIFTSPEKTCLRSGKCFFKPGSVQKASSRFSKFLEKVAPIISVGIAVNEGYNDYQENKQMGRAVVTTGTSLAKNAAISSTVVYLSPFCGIAAPACMIGGAIALGVYTPSAQKITDFITP